MGAGALRCLSLAIALLTATACNQSGSATNPDSSMDLEVAETRSVQILSRTLSLAAQGFLDQLHVTPQLVLPSAEGGFPAHHLVCPSSSDQNNACGNGELSLALQACSVEAGLPFDQLTSDLMGKFATCGEKALTVSGEFTSRAEFKFAPYCFVNSMNDSCRQSEMRLQDLGGTMFVTDEEGRVWEMRIYSGSFLVDWKATGIPSFRVSGGQVVEAMLNLDAGNGARFFCAIKNDSAECFPDGDMDGVANAADNCLESPNGDQQDIDGDGRGDACDDANIPCNVAPACTGPEDCLAFRKACPRIDARLAERGEDVSCPVVGEDRTCKVFLADVVGDHCPDREPDPSWTCRIRCESDEDCLGRPGQLSSGQESMDFCQYGCCVGDISPDFLFGDTDRDGVREINDNCPGNPDSYLIDPFKGFNPSQGDCDKDGFGDACDNCPSNYNPLQENFDFGELGGDAQGNACDPDDDNDGVPDDQDLCPNDPFGSNASEDGDDFPDLCDNCLGIPNGDQSNRDGDLQGDPCDPCPDLAFENIFFSLIGLFYECDLDWDFDGIPNEGNGDRNIFGTPCPDQVTENCDDNCPIAFNPDQADSDHDGTGDVCEIGEPPPPPPPLCRVPPNECAADGDCQIGEFCNQTICACAPVPPPPPACSVPPNECAADGDCDFGEACDKKNCTCVAAPPPPPPSVCSVPLNECAVDRDCEIGQTCDQSTCVCVGLPPPPPPPPPI